MNQENQAPVCHEVQEQQQQHVLVDSTNSSAPFGHRKNGPKPNRAFTQPVFNRQFVQPGYQPPVTITSSGSTSSFKTQEELNQIKAQLTKYEGEQLKEKFKLNSCYSSIERHTINLLEWDNLLKAKLNESAAFVNSFKLKVYYSNETQLNRLLFKNNYYSDLMTEIFDLQDKYNSLLGIIRQLQSVAADLSIKIEELGKIQEPLRQRRHQLESLSKRKMK